MHEFRVTVNTRDARAEHRLHIVSTYCHRLRKFAACLLCCSCWDVRENERFVVGLSQMATGDRQRLV
jgi:hypothetical protein